LDGTRDGVSNLVPTGGSVMKIYKSTLEPEFWFRGYFQKGVSNQNYFFMRPTEDSDFVVATMLDVNISDFSKSRFLFATYTEEQIRDWVDHYGLLFAMTRYWYLDYEGPELTIELTQAFKKVKSNLSAL
jgi:hypothetical protein